MTITQEIAPGAEKRNEEEFRQAAAEAPADTSAPETTDSTEAVDPVETARRERIAKGLMIAANFARSMGQRKGEITDEVIAEIGQIDPSNPNSSAELSDAQIDGLIGLVAEARSSYSGTEVPPQALAELTAALNAAEEYLQSI